MVHSYLKMVQNFNMSLTLIKSWVFNIRDALLVNVDIQQKFEDKKKNVGFSNKCS